MYSSLISNSLQILGFCIFTSVFFQYYSYRSGVEYSANILNGAKMYRDSNGVPNILAENLYDANFALGFAHAEDRLWQMYFSYKVALGEVSELFGEDAVVVDKFSRLLNFKEVCRNSVLLLNKNETRLLEAYINGVNHYLETATVLPLEFVLFGISPSNIKWELSSSCLIGKLTEFYLTYDFFQELIRTHLHQHLKFSKEVGDRIFPYKHELFEYRTYIIKDNEAKDLRYQTIVKTMKDVQYTSDPNAKLSQEEDNLVSEVVKGEASLDGLEVNTNTGTTGEDLSELLKKQGGTGSNNFVIGGKLTENGHPYIGNDPHLMNSMPSYWYLVNMKVENEYHFIGATNPGVPGVVIGTNSHIAWGITNGMIDTADILKIEKSKFDDKLIAKEGDKTFKLSKRVEKIYTNKQKSQKIELEFLDSEVGSVLNNHPEGLYALTGLKPAQGLLQTNKYYYILRSTFTDKNDENLKGMINLSLSKDIASFKKNLSYLSITLNLVFSDKKDNFGYQLTGKIPIRLNDDDGSYTKEISSLSQLNQETIPFDQLPNLLNPERGYVVTSNNMIINSDYKYHLQGGYIMDSRAIALEKAIEAVIKEGKKFNYELINERLLKNVLDTYCADILGYIFQILKRDNKEINSIEYLRELVNFDCEMKGDSFKALLFNVFDYEINHILHYSPLINSAGPEIHKNLIDATERANYFVYKLKKYQENPKVCLEEYKKTCSEFLLEAFNNAINTIKAKLGNDKKNWKWENLNIKHFPHNPFSMIPGLKYLAHKTVKTDGNGRTSKISLSKYYNRDFQAIISSNLKLIINLQDYQNQTYFSIDSGQSGRFFHRHYDDMQVNHERGLLIHFDSGLKEKYTLEFKAEKSK